MQLYPYQSEYLNNLHQNVIMAADVGLGKTIMALEHAQRHGITRLIVVAPASKVRTGDWQREIESFFDGSPAYGSGEPNLVTMNFRKLPQYEVLSYEMFTKRVKEFMSPDITLIFDECHFICNATSKRGKAAVMAARVANQWIMLSATPLPNGWRSAETYAVLTGLSRNKTDFAHRFEIWDGSRGFPLLLGYREKSTLEAWWARIAKPLKRTGDMQLPSQNIGINEPMGASLARVYKKAVKERLYMDEPLDNPSKLFVTLRQIPTPVRVDALRSILDSTDENVVIFYNFNSERTAVLQLLDKSFKERKIYEQSGHKSELPNREIWQTLQSTVTLVQYQSGSQAIELTYASVTVYLSPCTSYANYEQSKGRTRRNGQDKTTLFYHIAVEGTLDRHIWGLLRVKQDFSTAMMEKILADNK